MELGVAAVELNAALMLYEAAEIMFISLSVPIKNNINMRLIIP